MEILTILLSLAIGLAGKAAALPGPVTAPTKIDCSRLSCISEMHGVYNATSRRCECEWIPGFPIEPATSLTERKEAADLVICLQVMCKSGYHQNPTNCVCEPDEIFCPEILLICPYGFHAECNVATHKWSCKPDEVPRNEKRETADLENCSFTECEDGYSQHYDSDEDSCTCKEVAEACSKIHIECPPGFHAYCNGILGPNNWSCQPDVDPSTCPTIKSCMAGTHPRFNSLTSECYCNTDKESTCRATECPVEEFPLWNPYTETCTCFPIDRVKRFTEPAEDTASPPFCPPLMCILEESPVFNHKTGSCECHLDPVVTEQSTLPTATTATTLPAPTPDCSKREIFCGNDKIFTWNPVLGKCECQWV